MSEQTELAPVDLVCGGFPCQDLSVAGRRAGLAGERSGLFYEFMRIVAELSPRWVLVENVAGLLSSRGGRDMGAVVGTLAELGYGYAYCVLDSQYRGVPQRRRRVFIVGHSGGVCPGTVLIEPESMPWNPAPRRQARTGSPSGSTRGSGGEGGVVGTLTVGGRDRGAGDSHDNTPIAVAPTLSASGAGTSRTGNEWTEAELLVLASGQANAEVCANKSPTLNLNRDGAPIIAKAFNVYPNGGQGAVLEASETEVANLGAGYGKSERGTRVVQAFDYRCGACGEPFVDEDATGVDTLAPAECRRCGEEQDTLVFDTTNLTHPENRSNPKPGAPCHTLAAGAHPPTVVGAVIHAVPRRLTPRECERLQGFPDDWTRWGIDESGAEVDLADTPRYKQMGNAVTVPVARWIGENILTFDED